jgi:2-aminobenzoate-CoA ligase
VPDGEIGRLAVQGPTGCRYLGGDRQTTYVRNGWNITGDAYVRDSDGYFWFQARTDDMIISSGYNISGPEVEVRSSSIRRARVRRGRRTRRGARLGRDGLRRAAGRAVRRRATVAKLQEFTKQQIAPYKYPRVIEFVDELPRTNTGKLQRFRLRDRS